MTHHIGIPEIATISTIITGVFSIGCVIVGQAQKLIQALTRAVKAFKGLVRECRRKHPDLIRPCRTPKAGPPRCNGSSPRRNGHRREEDERGREAQDEDTQTHRRVSSR